MGLRVKKRRFSFAMIWFVIVVLVLFWGWFFYFQFKNARESLNLPITAESVLSADSSYIKCSSDFVSGELLIEAQNSNDRILILLPQGDIEKIAVLDAKSQIVDSELVIDLTQGQKNVTLVLENLPIKSEFLHIIQGGNTLTLNLESICNKDIL